MSISPVITTAGLTAVLNATNDGVSARIRQIALGDAGWTPDASATALKNERRRIAISNGSRIQAQQIHLTAVENGDVDYWIREIGFILDDGTLLAVWSHDTQPLAYKAAGVDVLLAFDLALSALPEDSVTLIGTGGVNLPPATQVVMGVLRFATEAEALAGTSNTVAMTPADVQAYGKQSYAPKNHQHNWSSINNRPKTFPPEPHSHHWDLITNKPASYPPSSHQHPWDQMTNKPTRFPPAEHRHDWDSITSKPAQFPPQNHSHSWDTITNKPSTFPPAEHTQRWNTISNKPSAFPPAVHDHDERYIMKDRFQMTTGFVGTRNRFSQPKWAGFNDWTRNYALIAPPSGYSVSHLMGFIAVPAVVLFDGNVNEDDILYIRWRTEADINRVRVICANSENRADGGGIGSYIQYLAIWFRG